MDKTEQKINPNIILCLCISLLAIFLPIILLAKGIYGSFIFTFSIPLIWQVTFLRKPINSLGLGINSIRSSIIIGLVSGSILGFIGGYSLKFFGVGGYVFNSMDKLQLSIGACNITFPLQKELGYRLLTTSSSLPGIALYLLFNLFLIGLGEEIFWRGFIQKKISGYLSANLSIWITAALFALIHFYIFTIVPIKLGIVFLFLVAISGIVWGYLFKYFNNVWASAVSHGITAFIIWKYYFFVH